MLALLPMVVLYKPIEAVLSSTLVKYVLKYVEQSAINDVIFLGAFLAYFVIWVIRVRRKYVPSYTVWTVMLVCSVFYLIHREILYTWAFTSFENIESLKYADIFLGITGLDTLLVARALYLKYLSNKEKTTDLNAFADDAPLKFENQEDLDKELLGYSNYAQTVAEKIKVTSSERAFAIGINGKWGSGKSTFMDALKYHLKGDSNVIYMDFNAWSVQTPTAIIEGFFDALHDTLGSHHSAAARLLVSYSHKLVKYEDNFFTQALQTVSAAITGVHSIEELRENVGKAIEETGKKLIVYIDDLDRADQAEVLEILRLVRNTANFPNTFFIVAYDRDYVVKALENHQVPNSDRFLEKIFQLEVNLPYFEKKNLIETLAEKLKASVDNSFHQEIESCIKNAKGENRQILLDWINTPRDVIRLVNAIAVNIKNLKGHIVFEDFLKLELLRIKYPSTYEILWKQKHNLFNFSLVVSKETIINYSSKEIIAKHHANTYNLKEYISSDANMQKLIKYEGIEKIHEIIASIFKFRELDNRNSVIYANSFNRYFSYQKNEELTDNDFNKAANSTQQLFHEKINEWVDNKLELELADMFYKINTFENIEYYEKIIEAIFHFSTRKSMILKDRFIAYPYEDLYLKIHNESILNNKKNNKYDCSLFIEKILRKCTIPYMSFEVTFISYCIDRKRKEVHQIEFILQDNTISFILCNYMEKHMKSENYTYSIKSKILHENLLKIINYEYKDALNQIIKNKLIEKDSNNFNEFLISLLYPRNIGSDDYGIFEYYYNHFYKDETELKEAIDKHKKTEIIIQFKKFIEYAKEKDGKFNFPKYISNMINNRVNAYKEESGKWRLF